MSDINGVRECLPEGLQLTNEADGLTLVGQGLSLRGDFEKLLPRLQPNRLNGEMLIKAVGIKNVQSPLSIIDATAGLGEDSFLLAGAGFNVIMYERDPIIAALLSDALARGAKNPKLSAVIERMQLIEEDSVMALQGLIDSPDVILLDPMFPTRQKSALIKKKFQLLQRLSVPCDDEDALLSAAIGCHPKKIVVKRPLKAPFLGGKTPTYSIKGSVIRYDCIVL